MIQLSFLDVIYRSEKKINFVIIVSLWSLTDGSVRIQADGNFETGIDHNNS